MADKLCKDCKYFSHSFSSWMLSPKKKEFAKCMHPKCVRKDVSTPLIAGVREPEKQFYCGTMREKYGECKPEGLLWEPRNG